MVWMAQDWIRGFKRISHSLWPIALERGSLGELSDYDNRSNGSHLVQLPKSTRFKIFSKFNDFEIQSLNAWMASELQTLEIKRWSSRWKHLIQFFRFPSWKCSRTHIGGISHVNFHWKAKKAEIFQWFADGSGVPDTPVYWWMIHHANQFLK